MTKTKIICTLGPATDDPSVMEELLLNGLDVARVNFSHGTYEDHLARITLFKEIRKKTGIPAALLLDTRGPEIRLGLFENHSIELNTGDTFTLTAREVMGNQTICSVSYKELYKDAKVGGRILVNDGLVALQITDIKGMDIITTVLNGGEISDQKSVNVPSFDINLPALTEKDINDLKFGVANDFDIVAASFIRKPDDVIAIRNVLEKNGGEHILVIAKIENAEGVKNFEEILRVADGIMVARGDLGVEMAVESVPIIQKNITKKCYLSGKPAIVATQMLESMIHNPRPTRAEASDIANAIYDGASTIMLSGETAVGKYPVETLKTMVRITNEVEDNINYWRRFASTTFEMQSSVTNAISHATCTTAMDLKAAAILTVTKSGNTARIICRFRPACPIIATTTSETVQRQLMLSWGIIPFIVGEAESTDEMFEVCVEKALETGLVKNGDLTVITAGVPVGMSGTTNLIKVHVVGKVLVQGTGVGTGIVSGELCVARSADEAQSLFRDGQILVAPHTNHSMIPILRRAKAVIVEDADPESHTVIACSALNIPVLYGTENATRILKSGYVVTIDSASGQVYCEPCEINKD